MTLSNKDRLKSWRMWETRSGEGLLCRHSRHHSHIRRRSSPKNGMRNAIVSALRIPFVPKAIQYAAGTPNPIIQSTIGEAGSAPQQTAILAMDPLENQMKVCTLIFHSWFDGVGLGPFIYRRLIRFIRFIICALRDYPIHMIILDSHSSHFTFEYGTVSPIHQCGSVISVQNIVIKLVYQTKFTSVN